ncbi:MAG: type VI secretion system baseplate subunit TssF, partial [Serratia liquefaciens]|nr:type VI secretion system baseplate subunit TssF [Serratia liquefaciens]
MNYQIIQPILQRLRAKFYLPADVERLLEGFAFLTGRLRQKLDDELPELSHSLMHLLWPNYMRP